MTPDELRKAGEKLYGARWQSALARELETDPRTVRRWLAGNREMPGPARIAIRLLLERR